MIQQTKMKDGVVRQADQQKVVEKRELKYTVEKQKVTEKGPGTNQR